MEVINPLRFTHTSYASYFDYWRVKEGSALNFSFELSPGKEELREETGRESFVLPGEIAAVMLKLVPGKSSALLTQFVAAISFLLHRYTEQEEIILHTPLQHSFESTIYENMVPVRVRVNERRTLTEYLEDCRLAIQTAYRYQNFPLSLIRGRKPAYLQSNIFLSLEGFHSPLSYQPPSGSYDLVLHVVNNQTDITLHATWQEARFPRWFIKRFVAHLVCFLSYFSIPAAPLADITILNSEEEEKLRSFNTGSGISVPATTIHRQFEEAVLRFSDLIAVIHNDSTLTYGELNRKANRLSHLLENVYELRRGEYVGMCLERSPWQLIAMLAIMKAGAVYVPVYTEAPESRRAFVFNDAGMKLLLVESATREQPFPAERIICLETAFTPLEEHLPDHNPDMEIEPTDLAYIIYTSGTTGRPKGVMVKHHGVANMAADQIAKFGIRDIDRVIAFAAVSFDASISEYLMALLAGAILVIIDEKVVKHTCLLLTTMQKQQVTVATLPPAYLRILQPEDLRFLRVLITAGEPADPKAASHYSRFLEYYNAYGPTENSVCTTIYRASPADAGLKRLPIGKPVSGSQVFVLDKALRPMPVGVTGRLFISGIGLSPGYLNQPLLSKEKFLPHWIRPGEQMYDSGDLARWLPDGNMEFIGRNDDLIKIDGIRVEPEEIRIMLEQHEPIARSAVIMVDLPEERLLAAFVEPMSGRRLEEYAIRAYLRSQLPDYMIPARIIIIDSIPINSSGKIDKSKLIPLLEEDNIYLPPLNEEERRIQSIWQQVLHIPSVSMDSHFFRLGASSIHVISLNSLMKQECPDFDIRTVFNHPVLRDFVKEVSVSKKAHA
ncbi:amino acid adenylation domain-containing protein [Chitinophaga polysaccharea]|uniref:non-ribosomal peptide synthetase n=1 Tax=Chitinophaga polysaccharea TaxID=1293035 RepID=UPI00145516E8|nr:non-ribosomal peptide synthetase [Chitinophaga polysaccharea]NLR62440.1 amino acid adenylation domain-containing protein [Chitinophaga polysaccharea]